MGNPETFSLRLREARERKKLTQKQLAELAGITAASVSAYEKLDSAKSPSMEIAIQLAKALGVSLDWLAGIGDGQVKKESSAIDMEKIERPLTDYLRMVTLLSRLGSIDFEPQHFEGDYDYNTRLTFWGLPGEFSDYLDGTTKLRKLVQDGTITQEQFDDWSKAQLDKYSDYAVVHIGELFVVSDLPF